MSDPKLKRALGLSAVLFYGIGDILGAGIYALVGRIAAEAGALAWLAFLVALGVAAFTALSYAKLGARFPRSGGEAQFVEEGTRSKDLATVVGWLVLVSGVVSLATVSRALAGYVLGGTLAESNTWTALVAVVFLVVVAAINFSGIKPSSAVNIVCTIVEVGGLIIVLAVGVWWLQDHDPVSVAAVPASTARWGVAHGAALAFFAFIGFEDMVNVAEEVKSPQRSLPIAILVALVVAGSIYIAVVWVSTHVVEPDVLTASKAPLLEVVRRAAPAFPAWIFALIAVFAISNTGLLNFIMGSRLLYGMGGELKLLPSGLSRLSERTKTPYVAIIVVFALALTLAATGSIRFLANTTSVLLLAVFITVNLSLFLVKWRDRKQRTWTGFRVPIVIPVIGLLSAAALAAVTPTGSIAAGIAVVVVGGGLVVRRRLSRAH